jgi:fatty-acyl-CoA synthase
MSIIGDRAVWEAESRGIELIHLTIGDLLDQQAAIRPNQEALVYHYPEMGLDLRLTFRQYLDEVNRLAKGLLALGIKRGENVAVWATNMPEWILIEVALAKIGAVLVTVNTNYRASEIEYVLRQGDITTLFMIAENRGNSYLSAGDRCARCVYGRRSGGACAAQARCERQRRRDSRALPRQHQPSQSAKICALCHSVSAHGQRQGEEVRVARATHRRVGAARNGVAADGLIKHAG